MPPFIASPSIPLKRSPSQSPQPSLISLSRSQYKHTPRSMSNFYSFDPDDSKTGPDEPNYPENIPQQHRDNPSPFPDQFWDGASSSNYRSIMNPGRVQHDRRDTDNTAGYSLSGGYTDEPWMPMASTSSYLPPPPIPPPQPYTTYPAHEYGRSYQYQSYNRPDSALDMQHHVDRTSSLLNQHPYTPHSVVPPILPSYTARARSPRPSSSSRGSPGRAASSSSPYTTHPSPTAGTTPITATASSSTSRDAGHSHKEQLQFFKDVVVNFRQPTSVATGPFVPQMMYKPHTSSDRRRYVEEVAMEEPIFFWVEQPSECGILLADAMHTRVKRLVNRDETVFEGRGPSVSVRIEWPGYRPWSRQIPTKDFRSPPGPITRAKLAKNVAKCVQRFIQERQGVPMEDDADPKWRIGTVQGTIRVEDLVLISMHHVSMGSWQPHLRLRRPLPS